MPICNTEIEKETRLLAAQTLEIMGKAIPENNMWALNSYTVVMPAILKELGYVGLPQSPFIGPIWGYLDASCNFFIGLRQIKDKKTHRPLVTKIKGVLNILSSIQITTLTTINFALLAAPSFAVGAGIAFGVSLDATLRAARRLSNKTYWLKDSLLELTKVKLSRVKLALQIEAVGTELQRGGKAAQWALSQKKARLKGLVDKQKKLELDIQARVCGMLLEEELNGESLNNMMSEWKIDRLMQENLQRLIALPKEAKQHLYTRGAYAEVERKITEKDKRCLFLALRENALLGLALCGAILLCTPGCQLPAMMILIMVTELYLAKNIYKFAEFIQEKLRNSQETRVNDGLARGYAPSSDL